jgi:epoxyqueuosine reductase
MQQQDQSVRHKEGAMASREIELAIKEFLSSRSLQAMGMGQAVQIPSVPDQFSAQTVLKGAKSVICYGVAIPKGILTADSNALVLHWRYSNMSYRFLDIISNQLCVFLEDLGHTSVPMYGCFPWKVAEGKFWGIMPLIYWAQEAGLGKLTRSGLLAVPGYGTRILLGGVVTTLELEPSAQTDYQGCPSACRQCVDICPAGAIGETGKVNHNQCIRASGANPLLTHLLRDAATKEKFNFETILNTVSVDDHGAYTCFKCLEVCPLNELPKSS